MLLFAPWSLQDLADRQTGHCLNNAMQDPPPMTEIGTHSELMSDCTPDLNKQLTCLPDFADKVQMWVNGIMHMVRA